MTTKTATKTTGTPAPTKAARSPKADAKTPQNDPVAYTGSKAFSAVMLDAGVALAETFGLAATADRTNHAVLIAGRKAEAARAAKAVDAMWAAAYDAFKSWKAEHTDVRRAQRQTPDGQRQMLTDERAFLADTCAAHIAAKVAA